MLQQQSRAMRIQSLEVSIYRVPTDGLEQDGTYQWDSTTLILVEAIAEDGLRGLGYSYGATAAGMLIQEKLAAIVVGCPVEDIPRAWDAMIHSVRNDGRRGIASHAISAVDVALWDLKARLYDKPLFQLLGVRREEVPLYGSGGFTNYPLDRLQQQLGDWIGEGFSKVKMKVGAKPDEDLVRVRAAREAIGEQAELFVDANGAYQVKQAIEMAECFAGFGVSYFEEPIAFDHLNQLAFIRQQIPMALASGEYGYDLYDFRDVLVAGAVDILQADATRCLGVTGCLKAADLAYAFNVPFSTHTAASIHAHIACTVPQIEHVEYFYDHARLEHMLFEGALKPVNGSLRPDPSRPGLGLEFKRQDAEKWKVG
jgi:L-alanine-DL-glutamate epimerase-like enolase superfamily enzyme